MNKTLKSKALSESGQGILCIAVILLLNSVAFVVNAFRLNVFNIGMSVEYSPRLMSEQAVLQSTEYRIFSVFSVLVFAVLLLFFLKNKIQKNEENITAYFAALLCACPAYLLGLVYVRHSIEFVCVMAVMLIAVMLTESKSFFKLVPLVCALGVFMNIGFIFVCLPSILLSLCGERTGEVSDTSKRKMMKVSLIVSVLVFAIMVLLAFALNGEFIGTVDLTQIADIALYNASSYDGELSYLMTDVFSVINICLPQTLLSVLFWIYSIKEAEKNGRKKLLFLVGLLINLTAVPALMFFENLGMILLFNVFSQSVLIVSLASKGEPTTAAVMQKFNTFFAKKRGIIFAAFVLIFDLIICAFIENKI